MTKTYPLILSFLKSAAIAFLTMAGVVLWVMDVTYLSAQITGAGSTVLLLGTSADAQVVHESLRGSAPILRNLTIADRMMVQFLLGTLFFFGGFFFHMLLLERTGEKLGILSKHWSVKRGTRKRYA